ncbi:MAG: thioredoxin family protein [Myxococcota bacterium]
MKIKVLGPGCMKCQRLYADVIKALESTGITTAEVEKVEKIDEIMSYGVMSTPALIIDGEVKSSGRLPKVSEIAVWIINAAAKEG